MAACNRKRTITLVIDSDVDNATVDNLTVGQLTSDLVPDGDHTRDLGSDAKRFKSAYIDLLRDPTLVRGGVARTIATTSETQTLTNKTLTNPIITSGGQILVLPGPTTTSTLVDTVSDQTITGLKIFSNGIYSDSITFPNTPSTKNIYVAQGPLLVSAFNTISFQTSNHDVFLNPGGAGKVSSTKPIAVDSVGSYTFNSDLSLSGSGTGAVAVASNGLKLANTATGYIGSPLNFNEDTSISVTWTNSGGAITGNATFTIYLSRTHNVVTATFPQMSMTTTGAGGFITATGVIPARYLPAAQHQEMVTICSVGSVPNSPGLLRVTTGGVIAFWSTLSGSNFGAGGTTGIWYGFSTDWKV
jgi:hypothetical protein